MELQSVQNANAQLSRIEKAIASLNKMPECCRVYDRKSWSERNMRIMYGGRDIDRQLEMLEIE